MNCCGQKRSQWQQQATHRRLEAVYREPVLENPVHLQYRGTESYLVKGPETGLLYLFAPLEPGLPVDGRDVESLLERSQQFSLANEAGQAKTG